MSESWMCECGRAPVAALLKARIDGLPQTPADLLTKARIEGVRAAQRVLAGEDTVDWARTAKGSSLALSYAIEVLDDLAEDYADDYATPPEPEQVPASEVGAGDGEVRA